RGHCDAGLGDLESDDHTKTISVKELVAELYANGAGLPAGFPGIIKLYNCKSSVDWKAWLLHTDSFGQKFADAMKTRGYASCKFYGYGASISNCKFARKDGQTHKWAGDEKFGEITDDKIANPSFRASDYRIQIYPKT